MKIALDPYMFRNVPLLELPALVAELGYEYIELSPRPDFIPFFPILPPSPRRSRRSIARHMLGSASRSSTASGGWVSTCFAPRSTSS